MIDEVSAMEELEKRRMYGKPPARKPHPQRCETCSHYKDTPYYDFCNGVIMEPIGVFDWVKEHGCASYSATHTSPPAPAQGTSKLCFGTQHPASECCQQCNELETCKQKQRYLDYDKAEAAKAAREQVLDKIRQHTLKAGFVRYTDKGSICNYTYINPKILLRLIESLRQQEPQQEGVREV